MAADRELRSGAWRCRARHARRVAGARRFHLRGALHPLRPPAPRRDVPPPAGPVRLQQGAQEGGADAHGVDPPARDGDVDLPRRRLARRLDADRVCLVAPDGAAVEPLWLRHLRLLREPLSLLLGTSAPPARDTAGTADRLRPHEREGRRAGGPARPARDRAGAPRCPPVRSSSPTRAIAAPSSRASWPRSTRCSSAPPARTRLYGPGLAS